MKLKRIEIDNFGKLKGFSLEFSDGMNFIYGNNEDGKTTLMSFIKMMFYGNVGAARDLSNLRKKYRPWDGSPMGGAIEFESEGRLYRIQKQFGTTAGRDEVTVQCLTTGTPVILKKEEEAGSYFFHMELDGFERSVFIGQTGGFSGKGKTDEITERLTNLTTSADENVSLTAAMTNLTTAAEQLVTKRGNAGLLVESRNKVAELQDALRTAIDVEAAQRELREEYEVQTKLQKAEKQRLAMMQQRREDELTAVHEQSEAEGRYQELQGRLSLAKANSKSHKEVSELKLAAEEEKLKNAELAVENGAVPKRTSIAGIGGGLLVVLAVVLSFAVSYFCAFLLIPAGLLFVLEYSNRGKEYRMRQYLKSAQESAQSLRESYEKLQATYEKEAGELAVAIERLQDEVTNAAKQVERKRFKVEEIRQQKEPELKLEAEIMMRDEAIASIRSRIRTPEKSIQQLSAELGEEEQVLQERQEYYDALQLAIRVMQESADELRQNFGPKLSERTAQIFAKLTKNRYRNVAVSKDFSVSVLAEDDVYYRDGGYLSNGTVDQVYFALRLAIVELLAGNENRHLPMMLDDIFEQYDEGRTEDGLDFLSDYTAGDKEQVIFFTCHRYLFEQAKNRGMDAAFLQLRR